MKHSSQVDMTRKKKSKFKTITPQLGEQEKKIRQEKKEKLGSF